MAKEGYTIIEQIGAGMNSNLVFLAQCTTGEKVAIKQIDLNQLNSNLEKETEGQIAQRNDKIDKEVMALKRVTTSEYVVPFYCSFIHLKTLWVVMELQEGSLRDVLKWKYPNGFEDEAVIAHICHSVVEGLSFLHDQKMIHRDIKTGNILFNKDGVIKLADFGVSAIMADKDEKKTTMVGTWQWMAPEVIDPATFGGYDFKADIWSLGITCIELAFGAPPYSSLTPNHVMMNILSKEPPSIKQLASPSKQISNFFSDFVSLCTRKNPVSRPTAQMLSGHKFFREMCSHEDIKKVLLEGLPSLGERFNLSTQQQKKQAQLKLGGLMISKNVVPGN